MDRARVDESNEETLKTCRKYTRIVGKFDLICSTLPLTFYVIVLFVTILLCAVGILDSATHMSGIVFQDILRLSPHKLSPYDPAERVNYRIFRCSVWGIFLLFCVLDICFALFLLKIYKRKDSGPFKLWIAVRILIIASSVALLVATLIVGASFLWQIPNFLHILQRMIGLFVVYRHYDKINGSLLEEPRDIPVSDAAHPRISSIEEMV